MNNLKTKMKYGGADAPCNNDSGITKKTEEVDADSSLQLPLKKRKKQTTHSAQLGVQSLLTTDRVTRISSGTIKPKSFSDLCKLSIKTNCRVVTGSPGKGDASQSKPKQGKNSKSDVKCAQHVKIKELKNKRTMSESGIILANSDTQLGDTVSLSTKTIKPNLSSVATNVKLTGTEFDTRNETSKLTVPQQQKGTKRKSDLLLSFNDYDRHLNVPQISYEGMQSEDAVVDDVVTDCYLRNQDSFSRVLSAVSLTASKPKCLKLVHLVTKLKSKLLDKAHVSSAAEIVSVKVANDDETKNEEAQTVGEKHVKSTSVNVKCEEEERKKEAVLTDGELSVKNTIVKVACEGEKKTEDMHTDGEKCVKNISLKLVYKNEMKKEEAHKDDETSVEVDGVNEKLKAEHPLHTFVQPCSNNAEGLQVYDTFNPEENQSSEVKRSRKQGQRKQHRFRCTTCKLRFFETKDELEVHVECHVGGKPGDPEFYRCKVCSYSSAFWNRILSHLIVHDEYKKRLVETKLAENILGKFPCPECGRSFERKVNMQGHLKKVHFKENHTCDQCGVTLSEVDKKTFMRHQEKCRNVRIACTFCDYTTTVTANMQKHMRIHNGEGFKCDDCAAVFPTRQRYQVHMLTHQTDRPRYGCEYCGMMFVSEDSVKKHCARLHQNIQRSIACPHCSYVARMKVDLKKHIQAVHEKKHKCPNCLYSTNSDHAFEQHKTFHLADHIFACSVSGCFYRGTSAKQVAVHNSNVHHQDSKHQCPVCKKYYKKKTHLLRHLVSHTGDRAYSCLECGQSFYSHSSYYRHRRRMQHDENRESIASIPQNITIQYLDEAVEAAENSSSAGVVEGKTVVDEAMGNVQVLYEQILQQSGEPLARGSSSAKLELTSLLSESNQDLMLEKGKSEGNAVTYLVEVKHDQNGVSNQAYYAISEQSNNGLEQGYYISNVVDNSLENVSSLQEVPPSLTKDPSEAPQYTLVVLPKNSSS